MDHFTAEKSRLLTDSSVFCIAPWSHIHILTTGELFPCCMSAHESANAIGNLRQGDTLVSSLNSEPMRALRLRMLRGEESRLCERCYQMERLGQESWRKSENKAMARHFSVVGRTAADGSLAGLHLPYLDVRFSNICNLKCRICTPKLSSNWRGDAVRLGTYAAADPAVISAAPDPGELMEQIEPLLAEAEHLHFSGGEPLIMKEHYQILDMLLQRSRCDVRLSYNTNLSRFRYRQYDVIRMWRDFPDVYVQASLDGMAERGDYMRKGQNWPQIVQNRERMLRECPHVDFCVLATVSIMNVLHLPDFYRDWLERGYIRPNQMQLNILFEPRHYNVRGLTPALKSEVERRYRKFIEAYLGRLGEQGDSVRAHFEAVLQYMRAEDLDVVDEFRRSTKALDLLRNESFADVFPELAGFFAPSATADRWLSARVNRRLGRVRQALGDLDRLVEDLNRTSTVSDPGGESRRMLRDAYVERGQLRMMRGDESGAEQDFAGAAQLDGEDAIRGTTRISDGREPLPERRQRSDGDVQATLGHFARARLEQRKGNAQAALESYARAARESPAQTIAYMNRRLIESRPASLLPDEESPVEGDMFANPAFGYYIRAVAKLALGDRDGAEADLKLVLALAPLLAAAMRVEESLAQ